MRGIAGLWTGLLLTEDCSVALVRLVWLVSWFGWLVSLVSWFGWLVSLVSWFGWLVGLVG